MKLIILFMLSILSTSCSSQEKKVDVAAEHPTESQIGEYVTSAFEDSKGNLWFGTLAKGIAKYDGKELRYYTKKDGLPSNRVTNVIEDKSGILWFSTGDGLSKFDGDQFVNFQVKKQDIGSNMIAYVLIDSKNVFWIGTWNGVYTFDGENFHPFSIPYPEIDTKINEDTKSWISGIEEDPEGNIWFIRDGYGLCKYDGNAFTYILKKDGLHSNYVTKVAFDKDSSIWIGTRVAEKDNPDPKKRFGKGGINKMIGSEIISFSAIDGFNDNDVYEIFRDESEDIWISTIKNGVYRYDGEEFQNYDIPISIMGMMNDQKGNLWLAGAGGLYKIDNKGVIVNVKVNGPW